MPRPGNHPEDALERPHPPDRLELLAEVVERELVLPQLLFELRRLVLVDRLLGLLDERQHVAHAEHPRHDAIGMEQLEILEPLAAPDERDRHADDRDHRERRAAARVAIELRQHDAGDADAAVELAGALDRVLPGHRVGDVEQIGRLHGVLDRLQLVHQVVVDVQAARRVDDDRVEPLGLGFGQRALRPRHRIHRLRRVHANLGLLPSTDSCSIAAGRRTSVDTISGCRPCRISHFPSLPDVVVLPEPCRPSSSTTRGVGASFRRPPSASPNSASSSSRTILVTC